ncbi:MAG: transcriptional regulator NrdR [Candidatus Anammoxibacter sp.]
MKCLYCKIDNDRVINSRPSEDGMTIKRRRECLDCGRRYTTYERVEESPVKVVKKDGSRVEFDRKKIMSGLEKSCEKRPVSSETLDNIVSEIELSIYEKFDREVDSKYIGSMVVKKLKSVDQVAYVRFASVYREFKDVTEFIDELKPFLDQIAKEKKTKKKK